MSKYGVWYDFINIEDYDSLNKAVTVIEDVEQVYEKLGLKTERSNYKPYLRLINDVSDYKTYYGCRSMGPISKLIVAQFKMPFDESLLTKVKHAIYVIVNAHKNFLYEYGES